jgi:hypothetical protein
MLSIPQSMYQKHATKHVMSTSGVGKQGQHPEPAPSPFCSLQQMRFSQGLDAYDILTRLCNNSYCCCNTMNNPIKSPTSHIQLVQQNSALGSICLSAGLLIFCWWCSTLYCTLIEATPWFHPKVALVCLITWFKCHNLSHWVLGSILSGLVTVQRNCDIKALLQYQSVV